MFCNASNDADAIHALQIKWYNSHGKEIQEDKTHIIHNKNDTTTGQLQSVLFFDPVYRTDSQVYTCKVFNHPESFVEAKSQLTVECKTCTVLYLTYYNFVFNCILDIEITPQSPHTVYVDDPLTIWCAALGLSSPTVQWYEGDKPVEPHATPYVQLFKVPTSYPHTTLYTCVARKFIDNANYTISANLMVTVQGTSIFLHISCTKTIIIMHL